MSSSFAAATGVLTPLEIALKESLLLPDFRDVHLYAFSKRTITRDGATRIFRPLPVVAIAHILKQTEYFSKLLTSGFSESNDPETANAQIPTVIRLEARESEYDYESDSDLDEEEDIIQDVSGSEDDASTGRLQLSKGKLKEGQSDLMLRPGSDTVGRTSICRQILLPNIAYQTLRACVFYLYTGKLNFRPFRPPTSWEPPPETFVESQAPACSPKSMFRLAESYGMTKLQGVAYDAIIENLTSSNIVDQAFSSFFWRYARLREHVVSVLSQNYDDPYVQTALERTIERIANGELPHAHTLLLSLLGLRIAIRPPSILPENSAPLVPAETSSRKHKKCSRCQKCPCRTHRR